MNLGPGFTWSAYHVKAVGVSSLCGESHWKALSSMKGGPRNVPAQDLYVVQTWGVVVDEVIWDKGDQSGATTMLTVLSFSGRRGGGRRIHSTRVLFYSNVDSVSKETTKAFFIPF